MTPRHVAYGAIMAMICCAFTLPADTTATVSMFVQPWSRCHQNDAWYANGMFEIGYHRIKAGVFSERQVRGISATGSIGINLANEPYIKEIIENAWVVLAFKPYLKFKAGKFKIPFGANNLIEYSQLPTVYRSFTTQHCKYELGVTGYRSGAAVFGSLHPMVDYAFGTFDYPLHALPGTRPSDLYRLLVGRLSVRPHELVTVEYMLASPKIARYNDRGEYRSRRLFLHDVGITARSSRLYTGFLELFFGVDTSVVPEMGDLCPGYTDNVAYSIYSAHSVTFAVPWNCSLKLTTAGEFLNGLNYVYAQFEQRPFYYTATQDVQLALPTGMTLELSYDMCVDGDLDPLKFQRVAAQISYGASYAMRSSRVTP
ncbi:MAG: hypothetical protein JW768_07075 [Chitinispirillaceae bacterium]|nr:hypothetical protein [Chitinispirillaceae bacterium]